MHEYREITNIICSILKSMSYKKENFSKEKNCILLQNPKTRLKGRLLRPLISMPT